MSDSGEPLPDDLALCHEIIRQQANTIRESQRRIEQSEHQVEQLLRRQYGPRRESVDLDQLRLFTDEEPNGLEQGDPATLPELSIPSPTSGTSSIACRPIPPISSMSSRLRTPSADGQSRNRTGAGGHPARGLAAYSATTS
jgi:hypothetical protein